MRYRELVDRPQATLDSISAFLGVEPGLVGTVAAENVSTFVADTPVNKVLRRTVRAGARVGAWFPPRAWRQASIPLLWGLKRTHADRPDLSEDQRASLVAEFQSDIDRLEQVTGQDFTVWRGHRVGGTYSVRRS